MVLLLTTCTFFLLHGHEFSCIHVNSFLPLIAKQSVLLRKMESEPFFGVFCLRIKKIKNKKQLADDGNSSNNVGLRA